MKNPPYPTATWRKILTCAEAVEGAFAQDNQLIVTMGGEPTFVPFKPDGPEWHVAALGPTKLGYARRLAHQLIADTHPGAFILETSGKHYPGEPIPRWTLLVQTRTDGHPLWQNPKLIKADGRTGRSTARGAKMFTAELAKVLDLPKKNLLPLREEDSEAIAGWVLPLDHTEEGWVSDDWAELLEDGTVPLLVGDSAAGLRLPLGELAEGRLKRAVTIAKRNGCLDVFIPPLLFEGYVALLSALETAATQARVREIVFTGYAPPRDERLAPLGLASDPGVLEINLTPSRNWVEYDAQLQQIYVAADKVGLCARKIHFNGRENGTGGGSHLVFGGPTPEMSPFFFRPGLLPSIIRYWQHNPVLSFAFTGNYVGPSSQAPRIDESTFEAIYELEIACTGAEQFGSPQNLALYDLLFRDLLMDRSGNTHRAEISVDKLWNPWAPNGQCGLVEFRSFETHPERSIQSIHALLVRAILARLTINPYPGPFKRWGGELHDRFFLPTFLWENLAEICADLQAHGIPFEVEWLRPFWEWRFPFLGRLALPLLDDPDAGLSFYQALEPWPLLGESPNGGGVSRTVDASMDRIEARVENPTLLKDGFLLVNGLPCPFHASEAEDVSAVGIRFRAFFLVPSLQPHIPVHAPLLLEWVDRHSLTVTAAARWHVWNPRHHEYSERPGSPAEAAKRAKERWEPWPHTIGQARFVPQTDTTPESGRTLDLRRYSAQSRG